MTEQLQILERGHSSSGTVHGDYSANCSVSIPDTRLERYYARLHDNCPVIDRWNMDMGACIDGVIKGPMLRLDVPEGFRKTWDGQVPADETTPGSLDYVSLSEFITIWRTAGARIGWRHGEFIDWEDGGVDAIDATIQL